MTMDMVEVVAMAAKIGLVLFVLLQVVPVMVWVERRGSALMQNRSGPNRVGPLGLIQSLADAVKFIFKEDRVPGNTRPFYFFLAPFVSVVPAFMTIAAVPFASSIEIAGKTIRFQVADLNVGILYVFAIASLGVYGIIIAGWASNSKYALFGSLRSTAQMISYELAMGLSVVGMLMLTATLSLYDMAVWQGAPLISIGPVEIPRWGIFVQPLGFIVFLTAAFAETNRLPFDLPEGESEIVAGYHLEYGAMKFALFMMAEYLNMTTASALVSTMYFGGWQMLPGLPTVHALISEHVGLTAVLREWLRILFEVGSFSAKVGFFLWFFVWVRWTIPRFRYDQLMAFGWKVMFPLSLLNILATGLLIYFKVL